MCTAMTCCSSCSRLLPSACRRTLESIPPLNATNQRRGGSAEVMARSRDSRTSELNVILLPAAMRVHESMESQQERSTMPEPGRNTFYRTVVISPAGHAPTGANKNCRSLPYDRSDYSILVKVARPARAKLLRPGAIDSHSEFSDRPFIGTGDSQRCRTTQPAVSGSSIAKTTVRRAPR